LAENLLSRGGTYGRLRMHKKQEAKATPAFLTIVKL
jgi:hypothetical protein